LRSRSTRRLVSSQRPPLTPLPTASALLHDLAAPGRLAGWRKAPCLFGPIIPVLSDKNVHIGPPWQAGLSTEGSAIESGHAAGERQQRLEGRGFAQPQPARDKASTEGIAGAGRVQDVH